MHNKAVLCQQIIVAVRQNRKSVKKKNDSKPETVSADSKKPEDCLKSEVRVQQTLISAFDFKLDSGTASGPNPART